MGKVVVLDDGQTRGAVEAALIIDVPSEITDADDIETYIREDGWAYIGEELGVILSPTQPIYGIEYTDTDGVSSYGTTFYTDIKVAKQALSDALDDSLEDNINNSPDGSYTITISDSGHEGWIVIGDLNLEGFMIHQHELIK